MDDAAFRSQWAKRERMHLGLVRAEPGTTSSMVEQARQVVAAWITSLNNFLDRCVLPWPVRFLTFRPMILVTIGLLIPLVAFANNTVLVLGINSYLNTMSVAVSSIVLLYTMITEARQKQIAEMQERRAQEDHAHLTEMHALLMQTLAIRNEELEELKQTLALAQGKTYIPKVKLPLPDLRSLHPRGYQRFDTHDLDRRWQKQVSENPLVVAVRKDLTEEIG